MSLMDTTTTKEDIQKNKFYSSLNLPVYLSAVLIIVTVLIIGLLPGAGDFFEKINGWLTNHVSWYYMLAVGLILGSVVFLAFSRFGNIKLGPDHSEPEYSNLSWFAMLFSTGMGIGIMFFGVAEPVMHYLFPPEGDAETVATATEAMNITFFHWGLHAWAIYAVVGLILAYFSFRMKLPLAMRSALYPIIGDRIYGRWGDTIDVFTVVSTAFGVATSLGFGVYQINTGLHYLFPEVIPDTNFMKIILIIVSTLGATLSVSMGLDRGIKFLSELNLFLAFALMLLIFFLGGKAVYLLSMYIENIGDYLSGLVKKTFNLYAYTPRNVANGGAQNWLGGWTIMYWGWWLSWSPFVGMFIARISRGRTIRNFICGVMLVPAGFTLLWMTIFGNTAIEMLQSGAILADAFNSTVINDQGEMIQKFDEAKALFVFLEAFDISEWMIQGISFIAVLMVAVFFITSADSGALVMDMISSKHTVRVTPLWQRVFWGSITGVIAIVLLTADGLKPLQTVTMISALPFSIVLLLSLFGLFKALNVDYGKKEIRENAQMYVQPSANSGGWQKRLRNLVVYPRRANVAKFIQAVVIPAFTEVKEEFSKQGIEASITEVNDCDVRLEVDHGENANFMYRVKARHYLKPDFGSDGDSLAVSEDDETIKEEQKYFRAEVYLDDGSKGYDIMGYTKDNISNDIVDQYTSHTYFIQNFQLKNDYDVGGEDHHHHKA